MKSIRYNIHFPALIVAALIFWLAKDYYFPAWISNFDFFHFGLMGALHATAVVLSLRGSKPVHPIISVCFITLATAWSAATPILALWSSILWAAILEHFPQNNLGPIILLLIGSAIGSSGYWLLVRLFWLKSLRLADMFMTGTLCVAATSLYFLAIKVLHPSDDVLFLIITAGWWFAFSISLYWSGARGKAKESLETV